VEFRALGHVGGGKTRGGDTRRGLLLHTLPNGDLVCPCQGRRYLSEGCLPFPSGKQAVLHSILAGRPRGTPWMVTTCCAPASCESSLSGGSERCELINKPFALGKDHLPQQGPRLGGGAMERELFTVALIGR
jgi:hypothetical protein